MAFDKLTLFELHFDGAQFGPRAIGATDETDAEPTDVTETADEIDESAAGRGGARRVLALVGASVLLSVVATFVVRRLGGGDEQTTLDDVAADESAVDVEA